MKGVLLSARQHLPIADRRRVFRKLVPTPAGAPDTIDRGTHAYHVGERRSPHAAAARRRGYELAPCARAGRARGLIVRLLLAMDREHHESSPGSHAVGGHK